ncbi:pheromone a factor receptor [[Candida] railenensis]|uniref:Pheromone a factor receptor n=1 Tax=[Candida] railenensis TaxID=45579 RepID=A0A9P0VVC0_9ASCO|nr:pheromone a factor receptor [[Candida] railenensis]
MSSGGIVLAVFSSISAILLIPPFIWHTRFSKNIPAIFLISWLIFLNLKAFINSIIWSGEEFDQVWDGKIYCDVATRLEVGSYSGTVCALCAISLNLYMILKGNSTFIAKDGPLSRRKLWINLAICLITPVLTMILQILYDSQRYAVIRYKGCAALPFPTWVVIILYSIWPFLWSIACTVIAFLTIISFYRKRSDLKDLLRCSNSLLNIRRFGRLLIYSAVMLVIIFPAVIYKFVVDCTNNTEPYNWEDIHWEYWQVIYYVDLGYVQTYQCWLNVGLSIVTFILFGLGSEALKMYKRILTQMRILESSVVEFDFDNDRDSEEELKKNYTFASASSGGATTIVGMSVNSKINTATSSKNVSEFQSIIDELSLEENFNLDSVKDKSPVISGVPERYSNLQDEDGNTFNTKDCEVSYHYSVQKL